MCKLFAYCNFEPSGPSSFVTTKINNALEHLFYINSYKQVDGSGLMWMDTNGNTNYIKDAIPSTIFTQTDAFRKVKSTLSNQRFVAGHTRFSTVGTNSWENTHPFQFGKYLGMQNGTCKTNHKNLVSGKLSPCDVDSASVFWSFDQQGIDATFEAYIGEGVFMFFDKDQHTFNIVKNDKRTLFIAELTESKGYIIATEADAIKLVCTRANLHIKEPVPVDNDKLITFTDKGDIIRRNLIVKDTSPVLYNNYTRHKNYYNKHKYSSKTVSLPFTNSKVDTVNDKEESFYNFTTPIEYIADCVISGNPILSNQTFFGNAKTLTDSRIFCSEDCVDAYEQLTGNIMYEITPSKDFTYA